ncbi:MAG: biotin synthase BioB [Myxococcota bacterium]|nr:biotin synthase BioB [Myxococcota bacterium]
MPISNRDHTATLMSEASTYSTQVPGLEGITIDEARALLDVEGDELEALLQRAKATRENYKGNEIRFCGITNAKSGRCAESCAFCSQSAHFDTEAPVYPLKKAETIVEEAIQADQEGAGEFSIVVSGTRLQKEEELREVESALRGIREQTSMMSCASLGLMGKADLERLRDAGLQAFHHNLETARSFHPDIVKTHSYEEEVDAIRHAKSLGLHVCSGGIFGMGESKEQRIEFLQELRDLDVDSIPLNFLNPQPGTPLEDTWDLTPEDCLKIIAVARLMMPRQEIFVCGGREVQLKEQQHRMFDAGANGTMVGNYLTTPGRGAVKDQEMLEELGLKAVGITQSDEAPDHVKKIAQTAPMAADEHAEKYHKQKSRLRVL